MIKVIIFDYGGIFEKDIMIPIFDELSTESQLDSKLIREKINTMWHLAQKGIMGVEDFWRSIGKKINVDPGKVKKTWVQNAENAEPFKSVEDFAKSLKKNGYKIVLLSNADKSHVSIHERRNDYSFFDKVYLSCEMGVRKPEKEIFIRVLDDLKISATEAIFIDDHTVNIESASETGIKSIQFKSLDQLKNDLQKILNL